MEIIIKGYDNERAKYLTTGVVTELKKRIPEHLLEIEAAKHFVSYFPDTTVEIIMPEADWDRDGFFWLSIDNCSKEPRTSVATHIDRDDADEEILVGSFTIIE